MRSALVLMAFSALAFADASHACAAPRARAEQRAARIEQALARAERALERGKRPQALSILRTAHQRDADDLTILARLLTLLTEAEACPAPRLLQEAERLSTRAEEPDDPSQRAAYRQVRVSRAFVDACLGLQTSAALEAALEDAHHGDLEARGSLARLGLIYVRAHALVTAERWLAVAFELAPTEVTLGRDYAAVLLTLGRSHDAARVLSGLYRRDPTDLALRRDYVGALTAAGRAEEALALLDAVDEACRQLSACAAQAARTALEAERPERALSWVEAADRPALLMIRGDALTRLGRDDEARTTYGRVLLLDPTHKRAKQALAALDRAPRE